MGPLRLPSAFWTAVAEMSSRAGKIGVAADELVGPADVVAEEAGEAALELVGAVFRDDVDDAGEGLPVLGVEGAGDDLRLLHHVVLDRDAEAAVVDVGDGEAVHPVADLADAPAAEVPVRRRPPAAPRPR